MAKVDVSSSGKLAGVWVSNEEGMSIGLVAEDGGEAYISIQTSSTNLPLAIVADADRKMHIQAPDGHSVKMIPIDKLVELASKL